MTQSVSPLAIVKQRLSHAFSPTMVDVIDDSAMHKGHAGYRAGETTHIRIVIRAACFADMSVLQRHRAVYRAIGADMMHTLHAVAIDCAA